MNKQISTKYSRILFIAGILLFISELWKQFTINCVLQVSGTGYCWWYFPFQLCSTPMYACLLLPLAGRRLRDALLTYLACFGLLAGVFAFFDTSGFCELGYLPLTVHSWVWHILLILLGLFAFYCSPGYCPDFAGALFLYLAGCVIAELINAIGMRFGTINMFYINPRYKMAQVCFDQVAEYAGNNEGILCYILSVILGAVILYILLLLCRKRLGCACPSERV